MFRMTECVRNIKELRKIINSLGIYGFRIGIPP
jgi:hypothetical protein